MELKITTRKTVKLRLGLSGASGFGKTYSALLLGYGITGDWSKIAVIDTENESASLYSDLGNYNVLSLNAPYSPERYTEAIKMCENAKIELIIIDSITHEWDGVGGCLQLHSELGGRYQDWAKITPRHQKFIDSILQSKCHVITTVRRKQDYDMSNENGRIKVIKTGTKEVTREGFEYELMLNFEIVNDSHLAKASKDRTGLFMNKSEFIITVETGKQLKAWCDSGIDEKKQAIEKAIELINNCNSLADLQVIWSKNKSLQLEPDFITAKDLKKSELTPKNE